MAKPHRPWRSRSQPSAAVMWLFLVAVVILAYFNEPLLVARVQHISLGLFSVSQEKHGHKPTFPFPGFDRFIHTQTLSPAAFGLESKNERVVIVGDTHGMNRSLHTLLSAVKYNPQKDTLFLVGDILAKSTEAGSLAILDFVSRQKFEGCANGSDGSKDTSDDSRTRGKESACKPIYAVRGNHDQMIIQWRAWRDWFEKLQLAFPSARLYPRPRLSLALQSLSSISSLTSSETSSATYDAGPPVGTGSQFLSLIESEWLRDRTTDPTGAGSDVEEWVDVARKRAEGTWRAEWWKRIPQPGKGRTNKDFVMFGDHYWIARDMKPEHAQFLFSLPLVIHVPSEHIFLAHGGLLPSDPRRSSSDKHQPLAHPPSPDEEVSIPERNFGNYGYPLLEPEPVQEVFPRLSSVNLRDDDEEIEELRVVQERALLEEVPQNRDPWVILNMRGVRKSGKITRRGDKGTPWSKIWNAQMKRCGGFKHKANANVTSLQEDYDDTDEERDGDAPFPCYPTTVVYGHAASRDLDVRRWTVGLDTGCLYGRRLTALVLTRTGDSSHSPSHTTPSDDEDDEDEGEDEDESSDEEEDELDETAPEGPFADVNARFAHVKGGSVLSRARAKRPKTWTRTIKFGDKDSNLHARLLSVKCPKVADLA